MDRRRRLHRRFFLLQLWTRRLKRFILHSIFHADDPPERLALGVAIGIFITFTPTIGIQMALVVFLAWILRANKIVGIPLVWISNPVTFVPIYYPCYRLGALLMGHKGVGFHWWQNLGNPPPDWWPMVQHYWTAMWDVALPLWVGCLPVATLLAMISYLVVFRTVCWYRMRRFGSLVPPEPTLHSLKHFRPDRLDPSTNPTDHSSESS